MRELPPLPKKVRFGVVNCKVTVERVDEKAAEFSDDEEGYPVIRISEKLCPNVQWQSFFHELIHLIEFKYNMNLKDTPHDSDVDRLAQGLMECFLLNKWPLPGD